jgi:[ribosomal protein S5]-alanine N-acetyltransferase
VTRPYFLITARLGFGVWTPDDLPLSMALWGDPRVTRFIGGPFSSQQVRDRLAREIANQGEHGFQYWPVFLLSSGEHVGCCGLRPYPASQGVLEFGAHLRPECWGQGYGREAGQAVIRYAFTRLGARGLFAGHHPQNEASKALLRSLGFQCTGEEYYSPTGLLHLSYLLSGPPGPRSPDSSS